MPACPRWLPGVLLALSVALPALAQEPTTPPAQTSPQAPVVIKLDEAYRMALGTHEQIRIAEKELEKSKLAPLKAWTLITPRASVVGSYTRYSESVDIAGQAAGTPTVVGQVPTIFPLDLYQANFQVVQPLYESTFFTRRKAATNQIDASRYGLRNTAREILYRVANAYYNVLKGQSLVQVARQTLDLANEEVRVAKARFAVGEETKTAVLRAEVDKARADRDLTQSTNNLRLAQAVLGNLISREPTFEVAAPGPVEPAEEPLFAYQKLALKHRDDLKVQEENLALAGYQRDLVQDELYPGANATFTYTLATPQTIIQPNNFWNLVVALNVPIFEGGLTYVNMSEAAKTIRQSELRVADLKKQIAIEVEDAYLQVRTLSSTLQTLEKQAELAAENYDIIFKQFQVGVSTSLDVTDALTSLTQARIDLANERYNYQVALLNLQRVTGIFAQDYTEQLGPGGGTGCLGLF